MNTYKHDVYQCPHHALYACARIIHAYKPETRRCLLLSTCQLCFTYSERMPEIASTFDVGALPNVGVVCARTCRVRTGIQATLAAAAAEGKLRGSATANATPTPRHPPPPMMNPPAPLGAHATGLNGLTASSMPSSAQSSMQNGSLMTSGGGGLHSGHHSMSMTPSSHGMTPSSLPSSMHSHSYNGPPAPAMVAPPPRQVPYIIS
jgi:hypothetical protein